MKIKLLMLVFILFWVAPSRSQSPLQLAQPILIGQRIQLQPNLILAGATYQFEFAHNGGDQAAALEAARNTTIVEAQERVRIVLEKFRDANPEQFKQASTDYGMTILP